MSTVLNIQMVQRLHSLLRQRTDLQGRLEKGPRTIKAAENNVAIFEQKVSTVKDSITQTKMKADEKQLQLSERESHIEKLKNQRNSCDSNREYQLLSDQIAADEQANGVLQDEILELLEKLESLEDDLNKAKAELVSLEQETEKTRTRVQNELGSLKSDVQQVESEIQQAERELPGEIRSEYQRLVAVMGEDVLAKVEDNTCGHCFQIINAQMLSQLTMSRAVYCGQCGSLMYLPSAVSAAEEAAG